jgi:diadenosine tetraphosphate (Ap4A) HIT family hydrolase
VFLVRPRLLGVWDAYPVTAGHALVIPTRHFPDLAGATAEERNGLWELVDPVMKAIVKQHGPVDGFNVGLNAGKAAGQTVLHLHLHVIPRRLGDVADPRGGVRYVIPEKANYLAVKVAAAAAATPDVVADAPAAAVATPAEPLEGMVAEPVSWTDVPPALPEEPLVFHGETAMAIQAPAATPTSSGPAPDLQLRFLTQLQCLLDGGSFSATYKYALLLALADLAVEQGRDGTGELALTTDVIAEKFIEYYWNHCPPFVTPVSAQAAPALPAPPPPDAAISPEAAVAPPVASPRPKSPAAKPEKIVSLLAAVYGEVDGKLPVLRANEAAWTKLLKSVRTVVQSTPLWKLQTIADTQMDFLYPSSGRGSTITLRPGIAFCLRRFHGLVGNLVRGAWVDWARGQNRELVGDATDIQEFLFGKELSHPDQADVAHFIPFARYPHDFAHNLVLASRRANADKSDHLAGEDHLAAWAERNATAGTALGDVCIAAGISSDLARTLSVARWAYSQAENSETPVWITGSDLARRLSGRWREILGG